MNTLYPYTFTGTHEGRRKKADTGREERGGGKREGRAER